MREFQKAAWQNTEKSAAPYLIATIDILNQVGAYACERERYVHMR